MLCTNAKTSVPMRSSAASGWMTKTEGFTILRPGARTRGPGTRKGKHDVLAYFVPATGVISNQFLEDLERIWALKDVIPAIQDPNL